MSGQESRTLLPPCYARPRRLVLPGGKPRVKTSCNAKECQGGYVARIPSQRMMVEQTAL